MIERRLVRASDKKDIGTLRVTRIMRWILHDESGQRLVSPQHVDSLIVTVANPDGVQIVWESIPMDQLPVD